MNKVFNSIDIPKLIIVDVLILMALGTVFVFSASATVSAKYSLSSFLKSVQFRNICYLPIAVALLYGFSLFDYKKLSLVHEKIYKNIIFWLLMLSMVLLVLVLIPSIGTEVNYARRWIRVNLGWTAVNFQPSELAKWSCLIFLTAYLVRYRGQMNMFLKRFLPICFVIGLICSLIVLQDFGTAAFIAFMAFLILVTGGAVWWHFIVPAPAILTAGYLAVVSSPARIGRIKAFLDPESFAGTVGYQAKQSLIALGSGGIFGRGLGRGVSNYGHLPEDTTDFVFAIIGHEFGFIGSVLLIMLYIGLVVFGIIVIVRCKDEFGALLAAAIMFSVTIQAAVNIGVVTVVLPTKGIPLPFVSAGGSSLLVSAVAMGLLVNIAKQSQNSQELCYV